MAARNLLLGAALVGSSLLLLSPPGADRGGDEGKRLIGGLGYREVVAPAVDEEPGFTLAVLDVDLARFSVKVLDARIAGKAAMTSREFCEEFHALCAINGGFFLEDYSPLGLIVCDGKVRNPLRKADWGVFYISGGKPHIVHTKEFKMKPDVEQALQVGPRLVVEGRPVKLKPQSARRSAIGIDARGHVLLAVSREGEPLASDLAALLLKPRDDGGMGLAYALNLDGGPSTQIYAKVEDFELDVPGGWPVPSAVGVFARE